MTPNSFINQIITPLENRLIENYTEYLRLYNVKEYYDAEFYMQINSPTIQQGWVFHISVIHFQFPELSKTLLPYLLDHNLAFRIPKNLEIHKTLQAGLLGPENQAKIIYIFPERETNIQDLARDLTNITKDIKGPAIITDIHLGNQVYTRFENTSIGYVGNDRFIIDPSGNYSLDNVLAPFFLPKWLDWPFKEIKSLEKSAPKKILNSKYLIKSILKNDPKGRVILGMYRKNWFTIKKCIIKEGTHCMAIDDYGRDIGTRLSWQNELYNKLKNLVSIPSILDYFEENGNVYIVFQFLEANSISEYIDSKLQGNYWEVISEKEYLEIIILFQKFLEQVQILHTEGYIHRDLNMDNFLVDNNKNVWIIDLELTYDYFNEKPDPPFDTGTYGYMSPQQQNFNYPPSITDDIYSIGALLAVILLRIPITRFNTENSEKLKSQFSYFINNNEIISLIVNSLSHNPENRPSIKEIIKGLSDYSTSVSRRKTTEPKETDISSLKNYINRSLRGLSHPKMLNNEGLWTSPFNYFLEKQGTSRIDRGIFYDIENGISGILHLLGLSSKLNLDVSSLSDTIDNNWNAIKSFLSENSENNSNGVFNGYPGIGIAIKEMIDGKLLEFNDEMQQYFIQSFTEVPKTNDFSNGIAGYGIALQKCQKYLPDSFVKIKMSSILEALINTQLSNGSWINNTGDNKNEVLNGFFDGVAGIVYFLLLNYQKSNNEVILKHAMKALNHLTSRINKNKNWPISNLNKQPHTIITGGAHIISAYIKAYEITGDKSFKAISEEYLFTLPPNIMINNISLINGIAGLAEIYLSAWKNFKTQEWLNRADWITRTLMNSSFEMENSSYWIQNDPTHPYAGFFHGNSGIIHLLLNRLSRGELSIPI